VVKAPNAVPVAVADAVELDKDDAARINVLANDLDGEGDA